MNRKLGAWVLSEYRTFGVAVLFHPVTDRHTKLFSAAGEDGLRPPAMRAYEMLLTEAAAAVTMPIGGASASLENLAV